MIVKVKSPKSLLRVLTYNLNKVEHGVGAVLYTQGVYNSMEQTPTPQSIYEDMMMQIPSKTRVKNIAFSCSLNPDPSETLSDEQYVQIAQEFMERMGYGDQPFIVVKHWDIARQHIHIISTRADGLGRKISDKHEGRKARKVVDVLERKYNLKLTKPDKEEVAKKKPVDLKQAKPINVREGNVTEQVYNVARQVVQKGAFTSIGGLNALLAPYNLSAKFTKSDRKGKQYDGIVYIPMEGGKPAAPPIPSKDLGRGVGYTAVKTAMYKSGKRCQEKAEEMRAIIASVMITRPKTLEEFTDKLKENGLELVAKRNENGRIYGATYVDRDEMVAISGSKLGSDFSANTLNELFGTTLDNNTDREKQTERPQRRRFSSSSHRPNISGEDWKEINWQKYLRRKYNKIK